MLSHEYIADTDQDKTTPLFLLDADNVCLTPDTFINFPSTFDVFA